MNNCKELLEPRITQIHVQDEQIMKESLCDNPCVNKSELSEQSQTVVVLSSEGTTRANKGILYNPCINKSELREQRQMDVTLSSEGTTKANKKKSCIEIQERNQEEEYAESLPVQAGRENWKVERDRKRKEREEKQRSFEKSLKQEVEEMVKGRKIVSEMACMEVRSNYEIPNKEETSRRIETMESVVELEVNQTISVVGL